MAKWKYLTIDELLSREEAVWLFFKRWDGGVIIPTAIQKINMDDDGEAYSIGFFSGNVQIVKGYGVYWWVTDRKPDQKTLKEWGWKDAGVRQKQIRSGLHEKKRDTKTACV